MKTHISPTPKTMLKRQIYSESRKAADIAAPIFADHKWRWASIEDFPRAWEIHKSLLDKIETMFLDDELEFISSGRLRVQRDHHGDGEQSLVLLLELGEIYLDADA